MFKEVKSILYWIPGIFFFVRGVSFVVLQIINCCPFLITNKWQWNFLCYWRAFILQKDLSGEIISCCIIVSSHCFYAGTWFWNWVILLNSNFLPLSFPWVHADSVIASVLKSKTYLPKKAAASFLEPPWVIQYAHSLEAMSMNLKINVYCVFFSI